MKLTRNGLTMAIAAATLALIGCHKDAKKVSSLMQDMVSQCAAGDQVKNVLFFGMSNDIGPGSIWRPSEKNGYIAVRLLDPTLPGASAVMHPGQEASCSGVRVSSKSIGTSVGVDKLLQVMPVSVALDLQQADSVALTAKSYQIDEILEGPFNDMLSQLTQQNPVPGYLSDFNRTHLIVGRAVKMNGTTADLHFSSAVSPALQAKYPTGVVLSGDLKGTWKNNNTLSLTSSQPVYVAVQMYQYSSNGFQGGQNLKPVAMNPNAKVDATQIAP